MKLKEKKSVKGLTFIVLFSFLILTFWVSQVEAKTCEEGLTECLVDAVIVIIANWEVGVGMVTFCLIGYNWCVEFMK